MTDAHDPRWSDPPDWKALSDDPPQVSAGLRRLVWYAIAIELAAALAAWGAWTLYERIWR